MRLNCETQPPPSIGWVALSSVFVVWSSRIGNISSHLHYMMFQSIQTIYLLGGYDPGNMSVSTYLLLLSWAQFSVVYYLGEQICLKYQKIYLSIFWCPNVGGGEFFWKSLTSFIPPFPLCTSNSSKPLCLLWKILLVLWTVLLWLLWFPPLWFSIIIHTWAPQ